MSWTNRRQWLQGTSLGIGGTLLSPILARLEAEGSGEAPPRRVVFIVQSNGINPTTARSGATRAAVG